MKSRLIKYRLLSLTFDTCLAAILGQLFSSTAFLSSAHAAPPKGKNSCIQQSLEEVSKEPRAAKKQPPGEVTTLSYEDRSIINFYTSNAGVSINDSIRNGIPDPRIDRLDTALSKVPDYRGTTYRRTALPSKIVQQKYKKGAIIEERIFLSTTQHPEGIEAQVPTAFVNLADQLLKPGERKLLFEIHGKTGKDIRPFTDFAFEREVLFRKGTKFRVLDKKREGDLLRIILEEAE